MWSMGVNQSSEGTAKVRSIINLHLMTGQIGRPGAGPFSLTGQPNAMGGREAGGLSHLLPGYRTVKNPQHRAEVEQFWGLEPGQISSERGRTAWEMITGSGRRGCGLFVDCCNQSSGEYAGSGAYQTGTAPIALHGLPGRPTILPRLLPMLTSCCLRLSGVKRQVR